MLLDWLSIFSWPEWLGFLFGLLYIYFAALERAICWVFGLISCALWAYCAFYLYQLYLDGILQIIYVGMSIWGLWLWIKSTQTIGQTKLAITRMTRKEHLLFWGLGSVLTLVLGFFFDTYTPAAATYLDAFTTVFSLLTTLLVVYKRLENWLYWIGIDIVYIYLYFSREGYLFMVLFIIYTLVAIKGYLQWRKNWRTIETQHSV